MRLRRLVPELTEECAALVPALEAAGLKATEHVCFTPLATLEQLLAGILDKRAWGALQDLREVCNAIEAGAVELDGSAGLNDALDLVEKLAQLEAEALDRHWQGFGVAGLDGLMDGFGGTGLIELSGPKSSGKTLLSLHMILRHMIMDPSASCTWIDTEGSFSPERAAAVLQAMHVSDVLGVLGRVELVTCVGLEDVRAALQGVAVEIAQAEAKLNKDLEAGHIPTPAVRPRLIVIDPISAVLSSLLQSDSGVQGYAQMMSVMADLSDVVRQHNLLCIVGDLKISNADQRLTLLHQLTAHPVPCLPANISSAFTTTVIKPALGTSYAQFPDITMLIQRSREVFVLDEGEKKSERRVVEVLKRKDGPASTWSIFDTDGISLYDVLPE